MKAHRVIPAVLILGCLAIGMVLLVVGIRGTARYNRMTAQYQAVDGTFTDYTVYSSDRDGTTYQLIYLYTVEGETYSVATDYGTGSIPEIGSTKTVLYNPDNPEEAVLSGVNRHMLTTALGGMFTLIPLVFIMAWLSMQGYLARFSVDLTGLVVGLAVAGLGVGFYYLMAGSFSIVAAFSAGGFWIAIPLLMAVAGVYQIFRSLFRRSGRESPEDASPTRRS